MYVTPGAIVRTVPTATLVHPVVAVVFVVTVPPLIVTHAIAFASAISP